MNQYDYRKLGNPYRDAVYRIAGSTGKYQKVNKKKRIALPII